MKPIQRLGQAVAAADQHDFQEQAIEHRHAECRQDS